MYCIGVCFTLATWIKRLYYIHSSQSMFNFTCIVSLVISESFKFIIASFLFDTNFELIAVNEYNT